ncbi:YlbG family protein [Lactobacillus kefiranofaciens]|uniref:YlbG family protein n=1 Tax=Lactobacillus kefiranofaciens TaxID=267818 RepID=UPI00166B3240|nr:YlbG family protein [Lactobacillus kefiranofaciens]MCJ2171956.1 YlbG family protein [Lactobacillus kefiranofaciens]QNT43481.1 YlbG family protein [Lactobacillus kefiranofaciens]
MSINQEIENTHLIKRVALIVYLKSVSDQYKLRHYGDIVYFSKKMKYCVLYVNRKEAEEVKKEISQLDFIKHVEILAEENVNLDSKYIESQITTMAKEAEEKLQLEQEKNEDQI